MLRSLLPLIAVCLVSLGCGGGVEKIPIVPVSGKITSEKPFEGDQLGLTFVSSDGTASGNAKVNADGTFTGEAPVGAGSAFLYGAAGSSPSGGHADAKSSKINAAFWGADTTPWKVSIGPEGSTDVSLSLDEKITTTGPAAHGGR